MGYFTLGKLMVVWFMLFVGWMVGWMDGWVDGWMDVGTYVLMSGGGLGAVRLLLSLAIEVGLGKERKGKERKGLWLWLGWAVVVVDI